MGALWTSLRSSLSLSYGQKLFLLATVPLVLSVTIISLIVANQSRGLADREIRALETQLIDAKREELKNYLSIARTAFVNIYGRAAPDDEQAKLEVTRILSAMLYGQDGYFFVFDYDGNNLVAPRQTNLIGQNWSGLDDVDNVPITDEIIRLARSGGGYHEFQWPKPTTRETAPMVVYVNGLQDWRWAIGTGIFVDDVRETVAAARADVEARIQQTTFYILLVTIVALVAVFLTGIVLNIRERRLADAKLKQALGGAIGEGRRISRDLRPGALDDLGLGPALQSLIDDFCTRTGITVDLKTTAFRGRLDEDSRIALYRVAQEAFTNIERHSEATKVSMSLTGSRRGGIMRIEDNGRGISTRKQADGGLGLRNMVERIEQLGGTLRIDSSRDGTVIEARVPLSHMLRPEGNPHSRPEEPKEAAE